MTDAARGRRVSPEIHGNRGSSGFPPGPPDGLFKGDRMPAFFIARVNIMDREQYQKYLQVVPGIIKKYHGTARVRTEESLTLEGPVENRRIIVLEFPSVEEAKRFYHSEEYGEAIRIRKNAAAGEVIVVETL